MQTGVFRLKKSWWLSHSLPENEDTQSPPLGRFKAEGTDPSSKNCLATLQVGLVPPDSEQPPCRHDVQLLHVAAHLMTERLVVFRLPSPLPRDRQQWFSQPL